MKRAYIALGSNLGNPLETVQQALDALSSNQHVNIVEQSSWYGSTAVGPGEQADYVNGIAELNTTLSPHGLLLLLQAIETQFGRERTVTWGARTLDLDLLWYNHESIDTARLTVPHPRMHERNFVLLPLNEIAPALILNGQSVEALSANIGEHGIWKLDSD